MDELIPVLGLENEIFRQIFQELLSTAKPVEPGHEAAAKLLSALAAVGRVELDENKRVVGIAGLSLLPTEHRLRIRGRDYFAWCAHDAVGIVAALGESADIISQCGYCHHQLKLEFFAGEVQPTSAVISLPADRCEFVRDELCPSINFYCDITHLEAKAREAGSNAGHHITLEESRDLGIGQWKWCTA